VHQDERSADASTEPRLPLERARPSSVEQLERLAALRASGALSDEEFALAKRKLLSD
jgi:hypothetical protein